MQIFQWILDNSEWIFSGAGATLLGWILMRTGLKKKSTPEVPAAKIPAMANNQSVNINLSSNGPTDKSITNTPRQKSAIAVLFIDDDVKFQVVNILKRNGWTNTRIIKDVISLEQPEVASAEIFFIDIQGVGVSLGFKDQGLGLVMALRKKYPSKKIVIYSAENANAFHPAFSQANERISKDADPYEFMEAVERLSE